MPKHAVVQVWYAEYVPCPVQVCGQAFTTAGFPPWMLRFSELYHLGSLATVTDRQLSRALQKYSNVSQRFGA